MSVSETVVSLAEKKAEPVPDIVEKCEELLARAKSGELREICFVVMVGNSGGYDSWASATEDSARQIGQVCRLAHRMQRNIDRDSGLG